VQLFGKLALARGRSAELRHHAHTVSARCGRHGNRARLSAEEEWRMAHDAEAAAKLGVNNHRIKDRFLTAASVADTAAIST